MQAPAKSTHRRSRNVPARLPERMPVPVLGLELAAGHSAAGPPAPGHPAPGTYPARGPHPGSDPYPGLAAGARPRPRQPAAHGPVPAAHGPLPAAHGPQPAAPVSLPAAGRGRRGLMLAVCCMSLFMVGLDNTIVNVGLPDIGRDLHAGVSGLQWTVAAYTIALAALLMFSGAVADRIGRRTIFQVGLSLFTLGSWLCSLAPGLGWLIGFRILQGVGGSMLNPAALGIITNTFTDPVSQFLNSVMLGSHAYAIIEGPGLGWHSAQISGFFAQSVAALAVLLAYEPRRAEPMVDLRFFRSVPFAGANLSAVCAIAAMAGFLFLSTLYLQYVRGLSALQAGLASLPMPVVMALCAPLAGRMVAKRGPRIPLVIAGAALTISSAALSRLTGTTGHTYLIVTYALFGIGAGMVSSPITNGVMSGVPKTQAGMASGMNSSSRQLGQSLGVAIVGSVLAASMRGSMQAGFVRAAHAGWWILAGCGYIVLLLGLVCTTRWARATAGKLPT